mgnify:CR=1 FL=1
MTKKYTTKIVECSKSKQQKIYNKIPKRDSMIRNKSASLKVSKFRRT